MKKLKLNNAILIALIAVVLLAIGFVIVLSITPDPLAEYITRYTNCKFVDWGDFHAFACEGGFEGMYIPLEPLP